MQSVEVQSLIESKLPGAFVEVSGDDGAHFEAVVVSDDFESLSTLERQRLVYSYIGEYITNGTIHALSFKTFTNKEWSNK